EWASPLADHFTYWHERGGVAVETPIETRLGDVIVKGTADLVTFDPEDGTPEVVDLKTSNVDYASEEQLLQVEVYTVGAAQQAGATHGIATLCYVRAGNEGWSSIEVDLGEAEARLEAIARRALHQTELPVNDREYRVGEGCRFCPARVACPAYRADLRAFAAMIEAPGWEITRENVVAIHERAGLVAKIAEAAKKGVQAFVEAQGGEVEVDGLRLYLKEIPPAPVVAHTRAGYVRLFVTRVK